MLRPQRFEALQIEVEAFYGEIRSLASCDQKTPYNGRINIVMKVPGSNTHFCLSNPGARPQCFYGDTFAKLFNAVHRQLARAYECAESKEDRRMAAHVARLEYGFCKVRGGVAEGAVCCWRGMEYTAQRAEIAHLLENCGFQLVG